MTDPTRHPTPGPGGRYAIRVRGRLDARRAAWFDGCTLHPDPDGTTLILAGGLDQAALHGLLGRVRDAGLPLVAVTDLDDGEDDAEDAGGSIDGADADEGAGPTPGGADQGADRGGAR